MKFIYEASNFAYLSIIQAPFYHLVIEVGLIIWVLWLIGRKSYHPVEKGELTKEEEEEVIRAWKPKSLIDKSRISESDPNAGVWDPYEGRLGKFMKVEGTEFLNLASHNYLGLADDPSIEKEAERCIRKYGVGSCGPRGFYGTVDVLIELEENIARFYGLEEAVLYSYGFSTIASAIPSYVKSGDLIFADEMVNFAIQKGLQASRSKVLFFKHNDVKDFERLLNDQARIDKKNPKKAKSMGRFCVVEGIYNKTGQMCPLNEISNLCRTHRIRLYVDEDISLGSLGATGRGITEHLSVPITDIDFISGSLENSLAAFGGFIVGSSFVVDHQRLSGTGYCFSASLPPLLAGAGSQALKLLQENPQFIEELQSNCGYFHRKLLGVRGFETKSHELSPVKHISLRQSFSTRAEEIEALKKIIVYMKDSERVAMVQPVYLEDEEVLLPPPSIRIAISRLLTKQEMDKVIDGLEKALDSL